MGFWAKNGVACVDMGGLNKIGKARMFENVRKTWKKWGESCKNAENLEKVSKK